MVAPVAGSHTRLATASRDGTVRVWDLPPPAASGSTGGERPTGRWWRRRSPTVVGRVVGRFSWPVRAAAWSPDGGRLAVGDGSGRTTLFDVETHDTVELIAAGDGSFAWHPASGRYRWTGDPRGQVWWSIGWRRVELEDLAGGGRPPVPEGEPLPPPPSP
ncbi:MAG: hypothetical protein ACK5PP_19470 [Acidimicrobiales bacterium]